MLLQSSPRSFVLADDRRYFPDGTVQRLDPTRPASAGELQLHFDVELVEDGNLPRVYVFTHTEQAWQDAREAFRFLLRQGKLSSRSYLEGHSAGQVRGLQAAHLDAPPHGEDLVKLFREAAYCQQNGLSEKNDFSEEEDEEWDRQRWERKNDWYDEDREEDENDDDDDDDDDYDDYYEEYEQEDDKGISPHHDEGAEAWREEEEDEETPDTLSVLDGTPMVVSPFLAWTQRLEGTLARFVPLLRSK